MSLKDSNTASDRSIGAVLGSATGDALAIPYATTQNLLSKTPADQPLRVTSSGEWSEGEWASSTAMAIPVLQALSKGLDVDSDETIEGQDYVAEQWLNWQMSGGKGVDDRLNDLFMQTCADSQKARRNDYPLGPGMADRAREQCKSRMWGKGNNNRAPARMASLALGYLAEGKEAALVKAAGVLTDLTQPDRDAREASALVALGVRQAILTGKLDLEKMTDFLDADRRELWKGRIASGEKVDPEAFKEINNTAVGAFMAAVAANAGADNVATVIDKAVRGGGESDRVAAIAGAWAGARFGIDSVPKWLIKLHGSPCTIEDLQTMVYTVLKKYN